MFASTNYELPFISPKYQDPRSVVQALIYSMGAVGDERKVKKNWLLQNPEPYYFGYYVLGLSTICSDFAMSELYDISRRNYKVDFMHWALVPFIEKVPRKLSEWSILHNPEILVSIIDHWGMDEPQDALMWLISIDSYSKRKEAIEFLLDFRFEYMRQQALQIILMISNYEKRIFFFNLLTMSPL